MPAPSRGTTVSDRTPLNNNTLTIPFTSTGLPMLALVFTGASNPSSQRQTFTVKYAGVDLVQVGGFADDGNFCACSLWKYQSPPAGTANLVVTGGSLSEIYTSVQEWSGLVSIGTPVTAGSSTGNSIATSALTPTANDIIVGCMGTDDGGAANTIDNGGTKIDEFTDLGGSDCAASAFSYAYTGGSITPSWSALGAVGGSILAVVLSGASATRTQEGFRFRNDDGSESTATWKAAQDTNASLQAGTPARIRVLVDTSQDTPSERPTLQYRKVGDADWKTVM